MLCRPDFDYSIFAGNNRFWDGIIEIINLLQFVFTTFRFNALSSDLKIMYSAVRRIGEQKFSQKYALTNQRTAWEFAIKRFLPSNLRRLWKQRKLSKLVVRSKCYVDLRIWKRYLDKVVAFKKVINKKDKGFSTRRLIY